MSSDISGMKQEYISVLQPGFQLFAYLLSLRYRIAENQNFFLSALFRDYIKIKGCLTDFYPVPLQLRFHRKVPEPICSISLIQSIPVHKHSQYRRKGCRNNRVSASQFFYSFQSIYQRRRQFRRIRLDFINDYLRIFQSRSKHFCSKCSEYKFEQLVYCTDSKRTGQIFGLLIPFKTIGILFFIKITDHAVRMYECGIREFVFPCNSFIDCVGRYF